MMRTDAYRPTGFARAALAPDAPLFWYLTTLTRGGRVVERGWMLAASDRELVDYARTMGYGIDVAYLGRADMRATFPQIEKEE